METLITLVAGLALGFFIFANLYDHKLISTKEIFVPVISRVDDAKLCGNCNAIYDAIDYRCCPNCTSTTGMFIIHYIQSNDPKVEMVREYLKDMREGKFRTTPKSDKVIQLDTVREEKVSASDLS
jgi:hypothetical protein